MELRNLPEHKLNLLTEVYEMLLESKHFVAISMNDDRNIKRAYSDFDSTTEMIGLLEYGKHLFMSEFREEDVYQDGEDCQEGEDVTS